MKKFMILFLGATLVLSATAQNYETQQPNTTFRSTGTLMGSGSTYSSNPTIDANGTAGAPALALGSPLRTSSSLPPTPTVDTVNDSGNVPVGDAVLPLLLLSIALGGTIAMRRRQQRRIPSEG